MPGKFTVTYKLPKELAEAAEMFPKAGSATLNRVAASARTQISREIRQVYNIKASDVNKAIQIKKSTSKSLMAYLVVRGKNLALSLFAPRQTSSGTSISIKSGSRKTIRSSFLATMKSGHKGVFTRKGKERLPIKELFTIGLPQMFSAKAINEKLVQFIEVKLPTELGRTIKAFRELGRE